MENARWKHPCPPLKVASKMGDVASIKKGTLDDEKIVARSLKNGCAFGVGDVHLHLIAKTRLYWRHCLMGH